MNVLRRHLVLPIAVLVAVACAVVLAQEREPPKTGPLQTAEGVVRELYELISFEGGQSPDWDKVRSLFLKRAVVVVRRGPEKLSVFSVDEFIEDFDRFAGRADVKERGYAERIIRAKSMVYGDIAHVLVLYENSIPGSARLPVKGVDSYQLARGGGRWWIVSITNETVTAERPVPAELRE